MSDAFRRRSRRRGQVRIFQRVRASEPALAPHAPLSALEAAAAGTELVLSDRSAEPEYFGPAATYCDPGDMQALRETVLTAYHRPPDEPRRAERRACVAAYTWQDVVCATLEAYRHAVEHARARLPGATRSLTAD